MIRKFSLVWVMLLITACYKDTTVPQRPIDHNVITKCMQSCDLNRDACMVIGRLQGQDTNKCMNDWGYCSNRCYGAMR